MRLIRPTVLALAAVTLFCSSAVAVVTGPISQVIPLDNRNCSFFSLQGVITADPIRPGSPWIAVPNTAVGYRETMAFIYLAKATGLTVLVETDGTLVCGYPRLLRIYNLP